MFSEFGFLFYLSMVAILLLFGDWIITKIRRRTIATPIYIYWVLECV